MTTYAALLRAVNVGGTGKLSMQRLTELCDELGFAEVRTYIQSGNVIFKSQLKEGVVRKRLEDALGVDVFVRNRDEMQSLVDANPFAHENGSKIGVVFLQDAPPGDLLSGVVAPSGEQVQPGARELYIYFPDGMGRSKLKLGLAKNSNTVRNMNTCAALVRLMS